MSSKPKYKNVDEAQRANVNKGKTIFKESPRAAIKANAPIVKAIAHEATKSRTPSPSTPKVPVKARTTSGISGKGGAMVGGLYRPMGSGGINQFNK